MPPNQSTSYAPTPNTVTASNAPSPRIDLVLLGIGAIIGTGIFVLTGRAAAVNAGPAVALSFIVAGIASVFAGLCYAEMASMIPIAGSAYTYSYATMGELVAWIIGWDLILEYLVAAAAVSVGWSGYVGAFVEHAFGTQLPKEWINAPVTWVTAHQRLLGGSFHSTGNYREPARCARRAGA